MNMPKSIATWCMIAFFLLAGLSTFIPGIPAVLTGIAALASAVFLFLGR